MQEKRRDTREKELINIVVNSEDLAGHPFAEQTESIDISVGGIAFYLKTPVSPRSFVSIDLSQSREFGYRGKVTGIVVRSEPSSEKNLVAAGFF
jgi:hypothetical protein